MSRRGHSGRRAAAGVGGGGGGYSVKSIVLDVANSYALPASTEYIALRQLDLYDGATRILKPGSSLTAYTSSVGFQATSLGFDTDTSLTGSVIGNQYQSSSFTPGTLPPIRIICVYDDETSFDGIWINNGHSSGGLLDRSCKDTKIYITSDIYIDTTPNAAITNGSLIWDGTLDQHVALDQADPQILTLL